MQLRCPLLSCAEQWVTLLHRCSHLVVLKMLGRCTEDLLYRWLLLQLENICVIHNLRQFEPWQQPYPQFSMENKYILYLIQTTVQKFLQDKPHSSSTFLPHIPNSRHSSEEVLQLRLLGDNYNYVEKQDVNYNTRRKCTSMFCGPYHII